MGRFISPDTVIQNPANPQCFNRYSYCLNNPLKYIDPSGHVVEIGGWDVRDIETFLDPEYAFMLPFGYLESFANAAGSQEYEAYEAFCEYTEDKLRIQTLENSTTHVMSLNFGDLGPSTYVNAETEKIGDNYEITLNNNLFNDMTLADAPYVASEINNQVQSQILVCYPGIALPNPIELIPGIGSVYTLMNTRQQYNSGEISFSDALLSYDCAAIGILSYPAGLASTTLMTIYNFAQDSRTFYQLAHKYGYPFR